MPSDYSDVQPESYDPEFISQISSRMQVPYSLVGVEGVRPENRGVSEPDLSSFTDMRVPDRIMVAGQGESLTLVGLFNLSQKHSSFCNTCLILMRNMGQFYFMMHLF